MRKPLKSQMRIKKAGGEWMWIKFKYERLPSFFFIVVLLDTLRNSAKKCSMRKVAKVPGSMMVR